MDATNILSVLYIIFAILIMLFIILNFIEKIKEKKANKYFYLEIPLDSLKECDRNYNYNKILFNRDGILLKKDRTKLMLEVSKKTIQKFFYLLLT